MNDINEKSWNEFKRIGLLWFVNSILHLFGWAIVYEFEDGVIRKVYPARVPYRGFDEKSNTEGYIKVSKYLQENINSLLDEAKN